MVKPPIPFPFPFTLGTDICHIPRIIDILSNNRKTAQRFIRKVLTEGEYEENRKQIYSALDGLTALTKRRELVEKRGAELGVLNKQVKNNQELGIEAADVNVNQPSEQNGRVVRKVGDADILRGLMQSIAEEEKVVNKRMKIFANFLAGRFAAKEAAIKAYQVRRLTYQDVSIRKQTAPHGMTRAPLVLIKQEGKGWSDAPQMVPLSISHDGDYATAVCIACEQPDEISKNAENTTVSGAGAESENGEAGKPDDSLKREHLTYRPVPARPPGLNDSVYIKKYRALKDGLYTRRVPRGASKWR